MHFLQQIILQQQIFYSRQEPKQRSGLQSSRQWFVVIGIIVRVKVPIAYFPVYAKNTPSTLDQRKVQGTRLLTQEGLNK